MFRRIMSAAAMKPSIVTPACAQPAHSVRSSAHTIATAISPRTKPTTGRRLPLLVKKMERSMELDVILALLGVRDCTRHQTEGVGHLIAQSVLSRQAEGHAAGFN